MPAFYSASIADFLVTDKDTIIGRLSSSTARAGFYQTQNSQTAAWEEQIRILKNALEPIQGYILFEYPIPRRGKRIDNVLLVDGHIIVIEFKIGATDHLKDAIRQVEDYCLDLRDFHKRSRDRTLIPVLVSTNAPDHPSLLPLRSKDQVPPVQFANASSLGNFLVRLRNSFEQAAAIGLEDWETSSYEPTPTIIETAQQLYAGQGVREITRSHAGIQNLTTTSEFVVDAIDSARRNREKIICFITGVPGAGKTLAGLNIVHSHELHEGDLGVFLSGNGPLVKVLSEALAQDNSQRLNTPLSESRRQVTTFIQNVHHFLDEYYGVSEKLPKDNIVIFDEAQRAWSRAQSYRKFKRDCSEPEMILDIMDRHEEWAVIVALIGGGQEINTGEAGLPEWGKTLQERFPHWKILISPNLKTGSHATGGQCLFDKEPESLQVEECDSLHLEVSVRSYKAEKVSEFVEHILSNKPESASDVLRQHLADFPVGFTRNLDSAKDWLRSKQRGTRRVGLVASSGARRLKVSGLNVQMGLDVTKWFLNPPDDARSSYYLEDPATEFDIQGLELDWTCMCWGGDLRHSVDGWVYKQFRGTTWQNVNSTEKRRYILNKYRVLLTRAREGVVIWVPKGSENDYTRKPTYYDGTTDFLKKCGIQEI